MPFVDLGDGRTYYELASHDKPVLVFSHSIGADLSMWAPQIPKLEQDFRILRYDTRGHGRSSVTPGDYTIERLARDVLALLDALGLERVHFCGLSMGGMIGMWLGVYAPGRLHRLVLCNTAARIGTAETWNARVASVRKDGMASVAAAVIERWFTPEYRAAHPQRVAQAQRMHENCPPQGYVACCAAIREMDQRDAVARIAVPTLVIYGAKDPATPPAEARFLVHRIPGAVGVELDAAHLSNVEQPEAFTEALSSFLSRRGDAPWMMPTHIVT